MNKTKIIKKNYEFRYILTKGKYYQAKNIEAFIKENGELNNYNLLGIAVSVKVGNAVKRNYIKRLIREAYKNLEEFIIPGYSLVFLWKKKIDTKYANYENVKKDMEEILKKACILEEII